MVKVDQLQQLLSRARRLPYLVTILTLFVLAGAIFFTTRLLRHQIRIQMASRDGAVLYAVASMHAEAVSEEMAELEELGSLSDPGNQLLVLLRTSRLKQVVGARLYDPKGRFVESFPPHVLEARLSTTDLIQARQLKPVSRFHPSIPLRNLFYPDEVESLPPESTLPLLEVTVPLHELERPELVGIAQFLIEGHSLGAELDRLDRNLLLLASVAFLVSGSLLALTLASAFRRLRRMQDLLADRTQNLLQANQELALAAKSSAVGAVTSHLIHGLKNPLSGLQQFVNSLSSTDTPNPSPEWQQAVASTRRMQNLINQVVQVLREQEDTQQYEISLQELVDIVAEKIRTLVAHKKIRFEAETKGRAVLNNRDANLITLILVNLLQNAIQVTPEQGSVHLTANGEESGLVFTVQDQGTGFPEHLKPTLFTPCPTTRKGGSGIGLAISKLLANHLQARLELQKSSSSGCLFLLALPNTLSSQ